LVTASCDKLAMTDLSTSCPEIVVGFCAQKKGGVAIASRSGKRSVNVWKRTGKPSSSSRTILKGSEASSYDRVPARKVGFSATSTDYSP